MKINEDCAVRRAVHLFILCTLLPIVLGHVFKSYQLERVTLSTPLRPRPFQACPLPHLDNGRVTIRSRNRGAVFKCGKKFMLFGKKLSTCVRGHWTSPTPVCVKPGCEPLSLIRNGVVKPNLQYRSAVLDFSCYPGYFMRGSSVAFCNGKNWNSTAPVCEADYEASPASCDFEADDLCGWTQEINSADSIQWVRRNEPTPSRDFETQPLYDHTLGQGHNGHYMHLEVPVPQVSNYIARIFSPVYSSKLSQDTCFTFWYHMHGSSIGSLKVYVKPEGVKIENVKPVFQKYGEQGDIWLEAIFNISKFEVPFQIVIESEQGIRFMGDIAFDDVRIANGSSCNNHSYLTTTEATTLHPSTKSGDILRSPQSCNDRCGESLNIAKSTTAIPQYKTSKVPELIMCDCHVGCVDSNTCCSDFHTYCIQALNHSIPPLSLTTNASHFNTITTTKPSIVSTISKSTKSIQATTAPVIPTKLSSIAAVPVSTYYRGISQTNTWAYTHYSTPARDKTVTVPHLMTLPRASSINTEPTFQPTPRHELLVTTASSSLSTARRKSSQFTVNNMNTSNTTSRITTIVTRHTTTNSTTLTLHNTILPKTSASTRSTPSTTHLTTPTTHFTTPTTTYKMPRILTTPHSTTDARTTMHRTTQTTTTRTSSQRREIFTLVSPGSTQDWLQPHVSAKQRGEKSTLPLAVGGTVIVLLAGICATVLVFIIVRRRRRRRQHNNLSDDSDVRFLTADEILDFTLATPKEYRDDDV